MVRHLLRPEQVSWMPHCRNFTSLGFFVRERIPIGKLQLRTYHRPADRTGTRCTLDDYQLYDLSAKISCNH